MADGDPSAIRVRPPVGLYPRWRGVCLLVFLAGVVLACGLAWKPSGSLAGLGLPHGVAAWLDRHGVLRNVPAFAVLAVPLLLVVPTGRPRWHAVVGLALLAEVIEYAQIWLPNRHFDWRDIVSSLAGVAMGWGAVRLIEISVAVLGWSRLPSLPWPVIGRASADLRR